MKKAFFFISLLISVYSFGQQQISDFEVSQKLDSALNECKSIKDFELNKENEKTECELIKTCSDENRGKVIRYKYFEKETYKVFLFYELNSELKYATHSEYVITEKDTLSWESTYYFKNAEPFVLSSLGHRYWNINEFPENEIINEYKKMD